jgi:NAD(P)-dependent dehydrogenase (short-subunit alcohol dehydrogenase family)
LYEPPNSRKNEQPKLKRKTMSFIEKIFSLEGKNAVIVGGGGVLAGAMAEGLAKAGANIAILDLSLENAQKQADAITALGVKAIAVGVDVVSEQSIVEAKKSVDKKLGRTDILINAAGINSATPFLELKMDEWDKIMNINLRATVLACQIFGRDMVGQKSGSIINISSVSSGPPLSKVFTYSASKAGINNITQNLGREWAKDNVRVNAIAPGFFPAAQNRKVLTQDRIESIMRHTPAERFGNPNELVGAVIWLASEKASSFVTGSIVRVDGGYTAMTI